MKKSIWFIFSLLVFLGLVYAQELPSIIIANNTGYTIHGLYVRGAGSDTWGENILPSNTLDSPRKSQPVTLPHPINEVNRYDIKVVDSNGGSFIKRNVQVRANDEIVFSSGDIDYYD